MKKNQIWIIMSIISILWIVVGISYAYLGLRFNQTEYNVVTTDCFEIAFLEENAINLTKAYPVSDEDGLKNIPYIFTIKNVCDSSADYQINLETLIPSGTKLPDKYLKIALKSANELLIMNKLDKELNPNFETEPTIESAVDAYKLFTGYLSPKEEKIFELRIWMHSEVTAENKDSMNAKYNGRITLITSYTLPTLADTIKSIPVVTSGTGLYEVEHSDAVITYTTDETTVQKLKQTEYRYAGKNPNNYVNFNNELWRIIGLVNTPEGQRIKLIRNGSIGNFPWDTGTSGINNRYGINEWSTSKMMELLNNGLYYNRMKGTCYHGGNAVTTIACDFSETGLTEEAKSMIDTVTWNLGSSGNNSYNNIKTNTFYNLERSSNTGKNCSSGSYCNDSVIRTTIWIGQVGLMYPSDYGYATSGGITKSRATCLNTVLYSWGSSGGDCTANDWLYNSSWEWTLTPVSDSTYAFKVFDKSGNVTSANATNNYVSRPTIYLKTNVKIESGSGSIDSPFELTYD